MFTNVIGQLDCVVACATDLLYTTQVNELTIITLTWTGGSGAQMFNLYYKSSERNIRQRFFT